MSNFKLQEGNNASKFLFYFQLCVLVSVLFLFLRDRNFFTYADEIFHYNQIEHFFYRDYRMIDGLTTIPGYHFVMAILMKIVGDNSIFVARIFSFNFAVLAAFAFCFTALKLSKEGYFKAMRWVSFPILTILFFLIYTDVFSLLFLIVSMYWYLDKKYLLALIIMSLSIMVRQSNIVWLGMLSAMMFAKETDFNFKQISSVITRLKWEIFYVFFVLICFVLFIKWNGGIAIGDKAAHEVNKIRFANIFFWLFLTFVFFIFDIINYRKQIFQLFQKHTLYFTLAFVAFVGFTFRFYIIDHPYNGTFEITGGFQHNKLANLFLLNHWLTFIFAICCFITILFFMVVRFERKEFYLLYIFNVIFLLPIWMIEQRYYLSFFTFFLLFKKIEYEGRFYKWLNWFVFFVITIIIVANIYNKKYFL